MHFDFTGWAIGNVTRDPELRFTQGGDAVCGFGIAMNHQRRNGDTFEDVGVTYIDVTCWRGLAEHVAETITKGQRVIVLGRLETEDYETRDGDVRSALRMTADDCGPSLMWATAEVTRAEKGSGGGGGGGGGGGQQRARGNGRGGGRGQQRGGGGQRGGQQRGGFAPPAQGQPPTYDYDEEPF